MAFPTYREHGVAWTRGVDPLHVMSLFRGVDNGGWDPVATGFNLYTIVIGAQCLHATGYAMGMQRDGAESAVAGLPRRRRDQPGRGQRGDDLRAPASPRPVVFFCQNNQYAISVPLERQSRVPLFQRAAGFGFPGVRVDGNDVLAVLAVTRAALAAAREGQGPTFIEAFTYRMGAHTTSDDPTRYRLASELEEWKLRDPIARLKAYLSRTGIADHDVLRRGRRRGRRAGRPHPQGHAGDGRPGRHRACSTTSTPSRRRQLAAQRAEFVAYHARFEGGEH